MRRLFQAEAAGRLTFERIQVIDRDPSCAAAGLAGDRVSLEVDSWNHWLAAHLSAGERTSHLVPYHWAPHILLDWLSSDLFESGYRLERAENPAEPPVRPPFQRETAGGDLALSHAEWLCPPACIEPALCPHTRGPKAWSLARDLFEAPGSFVFPCLHLAWGVGTIPLSAIFAVRDRLLDQLRTGALAEGSPVWIGSASHCHGLAAKVGFRAAAPVSSSARQTDPP